MDCVVEIPLAVIGGVFDGIAPTIVGYQEFTFDFNSHSRSLPWKKVVPFFVEYHGERIGYS
jgi:hypothetical protein